MTTLDIVTIKRILSPARIACMGFMLSLAACILIARGDDSAAPGFQSRDFAIVNGQLVMPGKMERGTLIIRNDRIAAIGPDVAVPDGMQVIDAENLFVYPGFLDAGTSSLLDPAKTPAPEAGRQVDFADYALAATRADNRHGLTPAFEAHQGLKLDTAALSAFREAGFTSVHVLPSGRIASGTGSLLTTSGAPLRESLLSDRTFAEFEFLVPPRLDKSRDVLYPATLMGAIAHLRQAFLDADHYATHVRLYREGAANVSRPPVDGTLETLEAALHGRDRVLFAANDRDAVNRALDFCSEFGMRPTLWNLKEAYRCLDRLQAGEVSVILRVDYPDEPKSEKEKESGPLKGEQKAPPRVLQDRKARWDERVSEAARLSEAQIPFALCTQGLKKPGEFLAKLRGLIQHGLPADKAVAALTIEAARVLGVDDHLGTLEVGKLGHVVVMTGPLEAEKSQVRYVFVDGQKFDYHADAKPVLPDTVPTDAAINLAGTWQLKIGTENSTPGTLELQQDGKTLTGKFTSTQGDGKITTARINDDRITLVVGIGAGDKDFELSFEGQLSEDVLSGTVKTAFGAPTDWSAIRAEDEQVQSDNPVTLSLATDTDAATADAASRAAAAAEQATELQSDRLGAKTETGGTLLIKSATVITAVGDPLRDTDILIKDGQIAAIGQNVTASADVTVIDAAGKFVMPGIIDTHSHMMIAGGVNEYSQSIVPEVRVKDVVSTQDVAEYRALAGGVTAARLLHGSADVVGGQDAVVKLKYGTTASEHIVDDAPQGVKFALGENVKSRRGRFPNTRMGVEATLKRAFSESLDYRRQWMLYQRAVGPDAPSDSLQILPPRRDLRLEALADIVSGQKFIHAHCYRADEILMLLRVATELGVQVRSLQHVLEGYKVAPEIVEHGASCSTFADWWAYKMEAFDAIPQNAALLQEAGANVVLKSDDPGQIRHMYLEAAKLVRYGNMDPNDAIRTITLNAARELSLSDRMGSIEVGKDANVAIFSGHPLCAFSRCEQTIIDGVVYFNRNNVPSAMSPEAAERSAHPAAFACPKPELVSKPLDLNPSPGGSYAIVGATLHPVDGPDIENGVLLIEGDKIAAIGKNIKVPTGAKVVDAKGLHVFPGLIDSGTTLGLVEIDKVTETHDYFESGEFQPDVRAGVALNADSELIPAARAGGITTVLMRPTGGIISGQTSLAKLGGWTASEMVLEYEAGLQLNWPTGDKAKKKIEALKEFFERGRLYQKARARDDRAGDKESDAPGEVSTAATDFVIRDPQLEALIPYLNREKPVFIEAETRNAIAEALLFAEQEKLDIVITGGTDAWKLADELHKRAVPVIVGPVMQLPVESYDPFDAPYANPGRLHEAGVKFCIRTSRANNSRNVPFEAAMAVAYGLPEDEALKAVTLSAAEILNIGDRVGSLTVGKSANLIISDGSVLQPTTHIKGVFVDGHPYRPESKQTRLYDRYRERLHEVVRKRDGEQRTTMPAVASEPPSVDAETGDGAGGEAGQPATAQ